MARNLVLAIALVLLVGALSAEGFSFSSFFGRSKADDAPVSDPEPTPAEEQPVPTEAVITSTTEAPQVTTASPQRGRCRLSGDGASCCAQPGRLLGLNLPVCLNIKFDINNLSVIGTLSVNNKTLFSQDLISARNICFPFPPPAIMLRGCLTIYHLEFDIPSRTVEVCTAVSVNNVVGVQFDCVRLSEGKVSIHNNRTNSSPSLVNVSVNKGSPQLSINKPTLTLSSLGSFIGKK